MPSREVTIYTQNAGETSKKPLKKAWLYWQQGGKITLLRTDNSGRVFGLRPGADRTHPWEYNRKFTAQIGLQVKLYFSRGEKPIPDTRLKDHSSVFHRRTVSQSETGSGSAKQSAHVAPNDVNKLTVTTPVGITLPNMIIQLTKPAELSIWPLLWELPSNNYHTDNLAQGRRLWAGKRLTVSENSTAPAPSSTVRPRERGLKVEGFIDARATGIKIQVLDAKGNIVQLRQNISATASVQEISGTLGPSSGHRKSFEAVVFFANAVNTFGPVQVFVSSDGINPPVIEAFTVHLSGFQIALVDDYDSANPSNGQKAGSVLGEVDEKIVVDFLNSPQNSLRLISAQTRARRMLVYQMRNQKRALSASNPKMVIKPQMPLWMLEFQIVGMNRIQLEDLMLRRKKSLTGNPTNLRFGLQYKLTLSWDGPDSGTTSPRKYKYSVDFTHTQTATLNLNASDHIDGINASGQVAKAFSPTPKALTFPVTPRRLPQVTVSGQSRSWGRQSTSATKESILIEWQPHIVNHKSEEIMRGGDGMLALEKVLIDGSRIDGGQIPSGSGVAAPPPSEPDIRLPRFRVIGLNPPSPANTIIDALVEEYYNNHNTLPQVKLLSLVCWQETTRRILAHEAGHQFDHRGAGRRRARGKYYGHEGDMPIFGFPHGYGYGQHDSPPVNSNGAWSFFENIKESIRRIMGSKATSAYNHINAHIPSPVNQHIRAVYQREIVRRYNGGREFRWNGSDWEINPSLRKWRISSDHSKGANPRLLYPNNTLGTNVVYFSGSGATTNFSWPINFTSSNYGPKT